MARITVVRQDDAGDADVAGKEPFVSLLLWDLDRVQSLREHTINPPGQERNIKPIDRDAVQAKLVKFGDATTTVEALLTTTVYAGAGDISVATIQANTTAAIDADEAAILQDLLSVKFIETGNFKLSFDGGVLAKAIELGWVKVFTDLGDALYSL